MFNSVIAFISFGFTFKCKDYLALNINYKMVLEN